MNSRTRIKHMEKFFATPMPPSPGSDCEVLQPARQFTSQQKAQLAQEYHHYESMDQLHDAKIKVLRDRQERKLQDAITSSEQELEDLVSLHASDLAELQHEHRREEGSLIRTADAKKSSLRRMWYLEEAILRRKLELRHGLPYGPLRRLSFNDSRDSAICVSVDRNHRQEETDNTSSDSA